MKACVIQPPYSGDASFSDKYFEYKLNLLDKCDESTDIIVLPEYSEIPCITSTREETLEYHFKYIDVLLAKCRETAVRCGAAVFVNVLHELDGEFRNTTYAINKNGETAGKYYKRHIPPSEKSIGIADGYTEEHAEPYVIELDGIRYGFLTCYDFYFYEAFSNIARQNVDIIIGCSLQRSDSHHAIETMCRFLAYNTNAYVIRASVSFSEDSDVCGASMVVSPEGKVLENMRGSFGMASVEFDPKEKYLKPAGFGNSPASHHEYVECGRRPWQYRPAGSAIVRNNEQMSYPRVCAHRGFNAVAPENSMPAFGAAVALGAEEIEFDLWYTKDREIVSLHDPTLERVSDGCGFVYEHTYDELLKFDFGSKFGENFKGLRILKFEDILKKFACHVIMNIHIKSVDDDCVYDEENLKKIIALIDKYDCRKYVYFMSANDGLLKKSKELAPDICLCCGERLAVRKHLEEGRIVERAILLGCQKVQLFRRFFTKADIDKAHANGILCNVFYADEPEQAIEYLEMGVDTVLTNNYNKVAQKVNDYIVKKKMNQKG